MDPLGLAKVFVKTVVRMFYDTEHIVVLDGLVFHGALTIQDVVVVLDWGKNQKSAAKIVAKLREGGLVSVLTRNELREGAMKATARDYYYIDYRRAIDATKYRLHILDERIKAEAAPTKEKKELQCRRCKSQWTHMEVMDSIDFQGRESGFLCKRCGDPLIEINDEADAVDHGDLPVPAKFNKFFDPLLKLMQQIDEVNIPAVEGADAVNQMVEVPRDKEFNPAAKHEVVTGDKSKPQTVKGIVKAPEKMDVTIATSAEYNEAARIKEQERQAKIAAQNQLPDWHIKSTITESTKAGPQNTTDTNGFGAPAIKVEAEEQKHSTAEANLDDVFAQIAAEQRAKDAAEAEEEEEDEDDDDEDEFEDVVAPSTITPPEAKRIKLETSAAPSPASGVTPAASTGDGGDESDEDEFVDV